VRRTGAWLRRLADRIDHAGAPKAISWSFTYEEGQGIVFRQDRLGCPLWYLGDEDYERAHSEAGSGLRPCCGTPPDGGHRGTRGKSFMRSGRHQP
jgi:hypothetical protein